MLAGIAGARSRRDSDRAGANMLSCKHVIIRPRPSLRPYVRERAGRELSPCLVQPFVRRAAGVENPGAPTGWRHDTKVVNLSDI